MMISETLTYQAPDSHRPQEMRKGRPVVDQVGVTNDRALTSVKVALTWPDGVITEGIASAPTGRTGRAHAAVAAAARSLEPVLNSRHAKVEVTKISLVRLPSFDTVLVRVRFYAGGVAEDLLGSVLVDGDVATAAVRALLDAVNRKLAGDGAPSGNGSAPAGAAY